MTDNLKLVKMIYRFLAFVRMKDGESVPLSFQDKNSYLGKEENYKAEKAEVARKVLEYEKWNETWIDNGEILARFRNAVECCGNLINLR